MNNLNIGQRYYSDLIGIVIEIVSFDKLSRTEIMVLQRKDCAHHVFKLGLVFPHNICKAENFVYLKGQDNLK